MDIPELTRRNFIKALAASVVAAGAPLPMGMKEPISPFPVPDFSEMIEFGAWQKKVLAELMTIGTGALYGEDVGITHIPLRDIYLPLGD